MHSNYSQNSLRKIFFRTLLYTALLIFVFDFNFYRYGVDIHLGRFMHGVVVSLEKEATRNYDSWRASL